MGLLDDLDNQAQQRKAGEDAGEAARQAREETYRKVLEPAMGKLFEFLTALTAKLKELQPRAQLRYTLPTYGDVVAYVDHTYDLHIARQPSSNEITLVFPAEVATSECPTVQIEGATRVRTLASLFQRHRLGPMLAPRKDNSDEIVGATFKAKGRISLSAVFAADAAGGQFRMSFTNFDDLATVSRTVAAERVGEALFDEIGRYLMRQPSSLMKESLSEDFRSQLRARVHEQEVKRRWESLIHDHQVADLAMLKRTYGGGAKLSALGDAVGKLRGLVSRKP